MYNTLIKILEELKQDTIVKACIEGMDKIYKIVYDVKRNGHSTQAKKLVDDTMEILMYEYPIYKQYVYCCLLLDQWGYGHFNTNYNTEVNSFIKNYKRSYKYDKNI